MGARSLPASEAPSRNLLDGGPRRIYDTRIGMYSVRVQPGECYVTAAPDETVTTVLGSCVAACIRDPRVGFGGMNHFMLPESETGDWGGVPTALRYGNHAMETLINSVLKTRCRREDLEIKLFGGANLMSGPSQVGSMNASFVLNYLEAEGLKVVSMDLGGIHPRVIQYRPSTGAARRLFRQLPDAGRIAERERRYKTQLRTTASDGEVELFD